MVDEAQAIAICIAIVAPILGVAFPILLEMISRLDDKYTSEIIIELFAKERSKKLFVPVLIVSLTSFALWLCNFHPRFNTNSPFINYAISHSAILIVFLTTALLIGCFFSMLDKIVVYYTPKNLLPYFITKHIKAFQNDDLSFFLAISDILFFSINKQNEKIAKTASDFMYSTFKTFRQNSKSIEIIYPDDFYDITSKAIEELSEQKNNKRIRFLAHRTAGSIWFLGEFEYYKISERTYAHIWNNLQLALSYSKEDYLMYHWEVAHQYVSTILTKIQPEYPEEGVIPTNQPDIDVRNSEIKRFLEFHIALGGLLLFKKEHHCIKRMFNFSQSIPPRQYLLPETMTEVFYWYFHFIDPFGRNLPFLSYKYFFPGLEGVSADETVKIWILRYIALLFVRQYTIIEYYVYMHPLDVQIPVTQIEKRFWLENLPYFKKLVADTRSDRTFLNSLNLDFITDSWCVENKRHTPTEIFDLLENNIRTDLENTEIEQELSPEKVKHFNTSVNSILEEVFQEYSKLENPGIGTKYIKKTFRWNYDIIQKDTFTGNPAIPHVNFDFAMAQGVSLNFKELISITFVQLATIKYVLSADKTIDALHKLNIDSTEFTIVSFGIEPSTTYGERQRLNVNFKNVSFLYFPQFDFRIVGNSLFILKTSDLPELVFNEAKQDDIEKYQLEKINEKYNVYTSIIDLNQNEKIREEYRKSTHVDDIRKFVYVCIYLNTELRVKEKIKIVQIEETSIYKRSGIANSLSDILPFE